MSAPRHVRGFCVSIWIASMLIGCPSMLTNNQRGLLVSSITILYGFVALALARLFWGPDE